MEPVHLYELKKGDKFKIANWKTGEPEQNIYIKGRPNTDRINGDKSYVTTIYAPGKPFNGNFTGYVAFDQLVYKVD